MTHPISATPNPYLTQTNRSFLSQGWVKVCLALTLVGAQPLIAQSLRTNSPSSAPSTPQPTFEIAQTDLQDTQSPQGTERQRAVIPPDRGAPDHTVGSGSR
ncbi:MAG: hypothetical protein ACFCBU_12155 [Cyanophyceae cyanobacterium]